MALLTGCTPSAGASKNFVPTAAGTQKLVVLHVNVMVDERVVDQWKPLGNRATFTENCFGFDGSRMRPSFPKIPWESTKLRNAAGGAERVCAQDTAGMK